MVGFVEVCGLGSGVFCLRVWWICLVFISLNSGEWLLLSRWLICLCSSVR